jgi:hypothetical protein
LREAANALQIATGSSWRAARPPRDADPVAGAHGRNVAATDFEADDEAAAIAELGQLLDALSDTVKALANVSQSPRQGHLRSLETGLAAASARTTGLSWPDDGARTS